MSGRGREVLRGLYVVCVSTGGEEGAWFSAWGGDICVCMYVGVCVEESNGACVSVCSGTHVRG